MVKLKNDNKMQCTKKIHDGISINTHSKFKYNFSSKHRAISDIIVSMLLIAVTVVAGSILFTFFSGPDSPTNTVESIQERPATTPRDIIISAYDTRDGNDIGGITTFDNSNSDTDDALKAGEYISITIRDRGQGDIQLDSLNINEIKHAWNIDDCSLSSAGALSGCDIDNGEFAIIDGSNPSGDSVTTNVIQLIPQGQEKRIIVRLSDDFDNTTASWIGLNKSIRVALNVVNFEPTEFFISAGGTR